MPSVTSGGTSRARITKKPSSMLKASDSPPRYTTTGHTQLPRARRAHRRRDDPLALVDVPGRAAAASAAMNSVSAPPSDRRGDDRPGRARDLHGSAARQRTGQFHAELFQAEPVQAAPFQAPLLQA